MKKRLTLLFIVAVCSLFIASKLFAPPRTIEVTSAVIPFVNGTYNEYGTFNLIPQFYNGSFYLAWGSIGPYIGWAFTDSPPAPTAIYYYNLSPTPLPPETGWALFPGVPPPLPVLSGNGTYEASLPVQLNSFSARSEEQTVVLEWITESEMDNLGFSLERSEENIWIQIASYQTHDALKGQGNTSSRTEYTFTDQTVESGKDYSYRISDVSMLGEITVYSSLSVKMDVLPETTKMGNACPNPFNPQTYVAYQLAEDSWVEIAVFDLLGRQIKSLYNGQQPAGSYHVYWNATDKTGNKTPSGVHFIRMQTQSTTQVQKVLPMK